MSKTGGKKDITAKVLIIGEAKVGKTSILTRYTENQFQENMIPTLGIDYRIKRLFVNGKDIKLQIWDTAGQERFRSITQNFYKGAMGIILVFDLTDYSSFKTLTNWIESISQYSGDEAIRMILGNKCDLIAQNKVPEEEIQQLINNHNNIKYFKTSAKQNEGIEQAFLTITQDITNKFFMEPLELKLNHKNNSTDSDLNGSIIQSPEQIKKRQTSSGSINLQTQSPNKDSDSCC